MGPALKNFVQLIWIVAEDIFHVFPVLFCCLFVCFFFQHCIFFLICLYFFTWLCILELKLWSQHCDWWITRHWVPYQSLSKKKSIFWMKQVINLVLIYFFVLFRFTSTWVLYQRIKCLMSAVLVRNIASNNCYSSFHLMTMKSDTAMVCSHFCIEFSKEWANFIGFCKLVKSNKSQQVMYFCTGIL